MAKVGRPTKYKDEYAEEEFIDVFVDYCKEVEQVVSLCGLAVYLKVTEETLQNWGRAHEAFLRSLKKFNQISKNQLFNLGLSGKYNATIVKLGLSANHGMNETQNQHITGELDQRIILGRKKP